MLREGNDPIHSLKVSPDQRYFLAYSQTGAIDGFPCVYIFDPKNFRKLNHIAVNDERIDAVEFSGRSNMLLIVSSCERNGETITTLAVWDFMDGHKDIFCESQVPL